MPKRGGKMKKADKKIKDYLDRAGAIGTENLNWDWNTVNKKERVIYHKYIIEIAKMIQREELK